MADEQYRWLDRETAERLLSGEPLGAVEGAGRDQAEHLARTLGALSATPPLTSDELPGEAAAVAAFRKARAERADAAAAPGATGGRAAADGSDTGLVRIGTGRDAADVGRDDQVVMLAGIADQRVIGEIVTPFAFDHIEARSADLARFEVV